MREGKRGPPAGLSRYDPVASYWLAHGNEMP